MQLVFEELCANIIRQKLPEADPYLRFAVEYSDTDNTVTLETRCSGSALDPLSQKEDELSTLLLKRMTEGFTATYENGYNIFCCRLSLTS